METLNLEGMVSVNSECIKTISHLGKYAYHNICNGNVTEVYWGFIDWFFSLSVIFLLSFFFCFICIFVYYEYQR